MYISAKRIYDAPSPTDGSRVLVDRLWPRGVSKESAHIVAWEKECAPSTELRKWFHADPEKRYKEFTNRYRKELATNKELIQTIAKRYPRITLVTAAKDMPHSHVPTLVNFLKKFTEQ